MLSWNDQIKHDSKLSTRALKVIRSACTTTWKAAESIWEFLCIAVPLLLCLILLGLLLLMLVAIPLAIWDDHKETKAREQAAIACEEKLLNSGFEAIKVSDCDYNSAELLAMKRCDLKHGMNNYFFESTNLNHKVLYKATPKNQSQMRDKGQYESQ